MLENVDASVATTMPYPPAHRVTKRQQLVRAARALFSERGFDAVSIDEIMASAGVTRGGFYSYFGSKSELYALAVGNLFAEAPPSRPESTGSDAAQQLIRAYLSERPADNLGACWSLVSPPSDLAHGDPTIRRVFETVFNSMVALFEQRLEREGRPDRDRALVMATLCVGAMVIARALDGSHLAGQVRATALTQALQLGRALKRKPGTKAQPS